MNKEFIELYARGRSGQYDSKAIFQSKKIIVLPGTKIAPLVSNANLSKIVLSMRNDKKIVDEDMILKRDVEFTSPSLAAQFVTANISNGLRVWKVNDRDTLKSYLQKHD